MLGGTADWALKRIARFLLKRHLGRLLRGELDLDTLDVSGCLLSWINHPDIHASHLRRGRDSHTMAGSVICQAPDVGTDANILLDLAVLLGHERDAGGAGRGIAVAAAPAAGL